MATIHLSGTQLAPAKPLVPKNRLFLATLAVLFVFVMHLALPSIGRIGLEVPYNLFTWMILSIALAVGGWQILLTKQLRYNKLSVGLALCCLLMTAPVFYPEADTREALPRLLALWGGWLFFVLMQQFRLSHKHKQRLLWLIVLACLIQASIGYVQYFQATNAFATEYTPPVGVFQQPELFASFLLTGFVLSGYLLARQPHKYGNHFSDVSLLYVTPFITTPLIMVSGLPPAWLTAAICIGILIPYLGRFTTRKRLTGWIISLLFGLAASIPLMHTTLPSQTQLKLPVWDGPLPRNDVYLQSLDMLIERPISGYGYGQFDLAYLLYTARQHALNSDYPYGVPMLSHPMNEALYWGVEGGILPLMGMLLAAVLLCSRLLSGKKGSRTATFALFLPLVVASQFGGVFQASAIHWIVLIILMYWADQRVARYRVLELGSLSRRICQATMGATAVISFGVLAAIFWGQQSLVNYGSTTQQATLTSQQGLPWWQDQRTAIDKQQQLQFGLTQRDFTSLNHYLTWAKAKVFQHPSPQIYDNMIQAYLALSEPEKAAQVHSEARYLYPSYSFSSLEKTPSKSH